MVHKLGPRVGEYCTGTSANITTTGPLPGCDELEELLTLDGQTGDFTIEDPATGAWEDCILTRVSANEYSRTFKNSSTGSSVTFVAGTKEVFADTPPRRVYSLPSYGSDFALIGGKLVVSAAAGALTVTIKTNNGNDPTPGEPVYVAFRDVTGTLGGYSVIAIEAANSLVISSGSTLGVTSTTAFRLWIVGFNDGGTFRLGAVNLVSIATSGFSIAALVEGIASATAEGGAGAADASGTIYAGAAVASKAMRFLGTLEWSASGLTAGTWTTTNLLKVEPFGPGHRRPGDVVQRPITVTGAMATGTTIMPYDNTIPQITEGDSYLSKAIVPTSAANMLHVKAKGNFTHSVASINLTAALFQDATAGCLAADSIRGLATNGPAPLTVELWMKAGTIVSTTFTLRAGGTTGATLTFNGNGGLQRHNGMYDSHILVEEVFA